jgi:drug/metabolite transporter (DMT)-like permease
MHGLHPLWATVVVYLPAVLVIVAFWPDAVRQLLHDRALWILMIAAGATNAAFNWAFVIGDVVRVVLLFYLMPLWSALLARWLLNERLSQAALARMAMSLIGAFIVLRPPDAQGWAALPVPQTLADWLGVIGGFTFALNNVMLKRQAHRPTSGRALAMFFGGALMAGLVATALSANHLIAWPAADMAGDAHWLQRPALWALLLGLSAAFLCSNLALQFGTARLATHVAAVLMLSEVLFASVSASLLGAGAITTPLLLGGALIILAAAWAARE